jgi:hypothetical protein
MRQLTMGALVSQAISVIARFGVADALAAGPRQVDDIAELVGAHGPALYRVLRALGDVGVVAELENRRFALTPLGELLRSDVSGSLRGWATMFGMPFHRYPWTDLYETVQTGESAFDRVHNTKLFDYLAEHPEDAAVFDAAMTPHWKSCARVGLRWPTPPACCLLRPSCRRVLRRRWASWWIWRCWS